MSARFTTLVQRVLESEGGYQNHPSDNGNYLDGVLIGTNFGITPKTLKTWLNRTPTVQDMKSLTRSEAIDIYYNLYYNVGAFEEYKNLSVAYLVFDTKIHHGRTGARIIVNDAYTNLTGKTFLESMYTPEGVAYFNELPDQESFFNEIKNERIKYLKNNQQFSQGWMNRINKIVFVKQNKLVPEVVQQTVDVFVPKPNDKISFIPLIGLTLLMIGATTILIKKFKTKN
jgi:lysozyme family protein